MIWQRFFFKCWIQYAYIVLRKRWTNVETIFLFLSLMTIASFFCNEKKWNIIFFKNQFQLILFSLRITTKIINKIWFWAFTKIIINKIICLKNFVCVSSIATEWQQYFIAFLIAFDNIHNRSNLSICSLIFNFVFAQKLMILIITKKYWYDSFSFSFRQTKFFCEREKTTYISIYVFLMFEKCELYFLILLIYWFERMIKQIYHWQWNWNH